MDNSKKFKLSEEQIKFLEQERKLYLEGKSITHTWEEVKKSIRNKTKSKLKELPPL